MSEDKFSMTDDEIIEQLRGFITHLASIHQDEYVMDMQFDDLVGELMLELAKGLSYYRDKPSDQKLVLLRRMMDNRIGELRYRYYITSRQFGRLEFSLEYAAPYQSGENQDADDLGETIPDVLDVEGIVDSKERVARVRDALSPKSKRVLDAVISGNKRLSVIMAASTFRSTSVFKTTSPVTLKAWHLADALFMSEKDVQASIIEIRRVYARIMEE